MTIVQAFTSSSPLYFWGGLFATLIVFVVISAILVYHWKMYGLHRAQVMKVQIVYFTGSAILLGVAIVSLCFYTLW